LSSGRDLLLLDTNVVIHLIRANEVGQRIDQQFGLRQRPDRPLLSVVSVGECLSLARLWRWGTKKERDLESLLRELVIVDVNTREVLDSFAEFHSWTRLQGRLIGDNDLWIAATAAAANAHLITTDTDFDVLYPDRITRTYIRPN